MPTRFFAALALVVGVLLVPAAAAHAVVTQGITGVISGQGVGPISGTITVEPVHDGIPMPSWVLNGADPTGFTISLQPGEYYVRFTAGPSWAQEWWGDSPTHSGATKVVVQQGQLTPLNPVLPPAGTITGHVDQDPGHVLVEARMADPAYPTGYLDMNFATTDANGDYSMAWLPAGSYELSFDDQSTHTEALGTAPVSVTAGTTSSGSSAGTFSPYGTMGGTVTSALTGGPPGKVQVTVERYLPSDGWVDSGFTTSADNGTWSVARPAGYYRLNFGPYDASLRSEYWNNATLPGDAAGITVATNAPTDHLDVSLEPRAVVNATMPTIAGTPRVGSLLTAHDGAWYPANAALSHAWFRGGVQIPGATGATYRLQAADLGKRIYLRITGAASGYDTFSQSTYGTSPVLVGRLTTLTGPQLHGAAKVGKLLRATRPQTSPASVVIYQWFRGGTAITGATRYFYRAKAADRGKRVGVRMTLTRPGYETIVRVIRTTKVR